ncbi:MAG TPA: SdrD B-like domain-containing protein, partial [Saprospiraceae bacterium]|nr:SdrD B-like domain-containing protein [Saprospiraceae bacterium]
VSPNITVGAEGVYDVTLTNAKGCSYSPAAKTVEVNPAPVGVIKALEINNLGQITGVSYPSFATCAGEDVNLQVFDNGNFNYLWSGGSGNSEVITFSEDRDNALSVGTHVYTVTITNPNTGCTAVAPPFDVTVNPLPSGFSLSANNVCAGTPSIITYTGPQPPDWQILWNTGESGPNPLVTEEAGFYFVRVVNEHGCVAQSNKVVIFPGPNIAALPSGCHSRCNPDTLCLPGLPDIVSWQWYFEGAPITGATSHDFVATQSGTYWADLVDVNGCNAQSAPLTLDLYQGSGDILGQVWSDVNDNGMIDAADTLVSGVPVLLLQNNAQVAASQSAANGSFDFLNILSTDYIVQIDSQMLSPLWEIVIGENLVTLYGCAVKGYADLLVDYHKCSPLAGSVQLTACPGALVMYDGTAILAGQSKDFVFKNSSGCDSVVTVSVDALPVSAST